MLYKKRKISQLKICRNDTDNRISRRVIIVIIKIFHMFKKLKD